MPLEAPAAIESPGRNSGWRTVHPMNDQTRTAKLGPQTTKAQGRVGAPHLHEGGSDGNARGPRDDGDRGTRRYADGAAGSSPSKQRERKDAGWTSRQGGTKETER